MLRQGNEGRRSRCVVVRPVRYRITTGLADDPEVVVVRREEDDLVASPAGDDAHDVGQGRRPGPPFERRHAGNCASAVGEDRHQHAGFRVAVERARPPEEAAVPLEDFFVGAGDDQDAVRLPEHSAVEGRPHPEDGERIGDAPGTAFELGGDDQVFGGHRDPVQDDGDALRHDPVHREGGEQRVGPGPRAQAGRTEFSGDEPGGLLVPRREASPPREPVVAQVPEDPLDVSPVDVRPRQGGGPQEQGEKEREEHCQEDRGPFHPHNIKKPRPSHNDRGYVWCVRRGSRRI